VTPARVPIGAEARGRLRAWKRLTRDHYDRIQRIVASKQFLAAASDFARKRGLGRGRALARLRAMMALAHFQQARMDGPGAHALWATLKPRGAIIDGDADVGPGRLQDCTTVDFVVAGDIDRPDGTRFVGHAVGFWCMEFQDHALARLIQRAPQADIPATLWEAHKNALAIRFAPLAGRTLVIPAGPGAFLAELLSGRDSELGGCTFLFLQARTWISAEMALGTPAPTTTAPGERAGDSILLPLPLRRLWTTPAVHP
jgi:hypothetical protein